MAARKRAEAAHVPGHPEHPHSVAILPAESAGDEPAESVESVVDPEVRYRMISEAAYHRYAGRAYADGYDLDDWLEAETEVDRLLLRTRRSEESNAAT